MAAVLFVCTGNMYRSPLAAEIFRGMLLHDPQRAGWQVGSAGTWTTPGRPVPNDAIAIGAALGINLAAHRSRLVDKALMTAYDLILVMEAGHKEALQVEFPFAHDKIQLLSRVLQGLEYDIADPAAAPRETKIILTELAGMLRAGYAAICRCVE